MVACEGRGDVGDGEQDEKARADGIIVFDMQRAAVFGDDACGDGQAQAGAAILGGKMRQE